MDLLDRHTYKASATSVRVFLDGFGFLSEDLNLTPVLSMPPPPTWVLSRVWFSMGLVLYRISIDYSPGADTALPEGMCRVALAEQQREGWATHLPATWDPPTTFSTTSEAAGTAEPGTYSWNHRWSWTQGAYVRWHADECINVQMKG